MSPDIRKIAESFDARAPGYARNDWHRRSAERLVALCPLRRGDRVLDAGTGTGFAALAAARVVGNDGRVIGVDISAGMLREAEAALKQSELTNVEFIRADASHLPQFGARTFDAIVCATGLLYIPVHQALREWHRLLKAGGVVAFSTMASGFPRGARVFRDCAAELGIQLHDPAARLGSSSACARLLEENGFGSIEVVCEPIEFSDEDLAVAWESSVHSHAAKYPEIGRLHENDRRELQARFLAALAAEAPDSLKAAEILYAIGRVDRPNPVIRCTRG